MKSLLVLAAVAAVAGSPAMAQDNADFTGVRLGVTAGYDDVVNAPDTTDVVYGADVGLDVPAGDKVTLGVEAFSTNVFEDERTFGAAARLGYAVNKDLLVFTRAGYSNYEDVFSRELDGFTVGGGLEYMISDMTYAKAEYRYSEFEQSVGNHGALIGLGVRF